MLNDAELKKAVEDELRWDPSVHASAIGVAVRDGVVTLSGHVETYVEKLAAEKALRRIAGVRAIALELDVRLSPQHVRSDTEIAGAARQALALSVLVPPGRVGLSVDAGRIVLTGEVEWDYERRAAEKAVRTLAGVVSVDNRLALKPRVGTPAELKSRIDEALTRQVSRELKNIAVEVNGSTVTLRGRVHSWHERDAAYGVACSAPGVRAVFNELRIA